MKLILLILIQITIFTISPSRAQKYDPVDGGFETRERKIQAQTNPRLQSKNLEEWMGLNLGYAPAGGLIQHNGGISYTWLAGVPVVWKGPNEGQRIVKSNVTKDIEPLKPYAAKKCVCIFNHEISNQEYLDFVTDVFLERMRLLNPKLTFMDKRGNFTDSFLNSLVKNFLKPGVTVSKLKTGATLGSVLIQNVQDSTTKKDQFLHELLNLGKITYDGIRIFPDGSGWNDNLFDGPMAEYYLCYPSYSNYPACNLSQAQAMAYCRWLSIQLSSMSGKDVVVSLPTELEWIQAASYESEESNSIYKPSVNTFWRNEKGDYIANHVGYKTPEQRKKYEDWLRQIQSNRPNTTLSKSDSLRMFSAAAMELDAGGVFFGLSTAVVYSYWPNDAGCYNIFGNVAEMTSTMEGDMMVIKGGSFLDVGDVLFPGSRAMVYSGEHQPMVGFRPVVKMR
jgi:formylglycine-generating enzyme required for sulfatase activity